MDAERRRAALAVAFAALLVASVALAGDYLALAAPASGTVYAGADRANGGSLGARAAGLALGPTTVENPYGRAEVRYDRWGVPHVTAENGRALAFAVGYLQARDRLFQMDLQRRLMAGNLSAAFGARAVASDRFHRKMDFEGAAAASWAAVQGTEAAAEIRAFSAGVNASIERGPLPREFALNDYRPTRWTPTDTLLVSKLIAWRLTGDFRDLRAAVAHRRLEDAGELYPRYLDHDATILGRAGPGPTPDDTDPSAVGAGASAAGPVTDGSAGEGDQPGGRLGGDYRPLATHLAGHEPDARLASNSWVVSGEHTASGRPVLANDPHLSLTVPPVWYEMHLRAGGMDVRGVAFPGVPSIVIGANDHVAWGFTNVGADVTDLYTYVRPSEDTYRYEGEVRRVRERTETIRVKDGEDVQVRVRKTVHGPLIEREGEEVAVGWLGLTGTREAVAARRLNRAGGLADVRSALRAFDSPTQNVVAMARDGGTLYRAAGEYPIRRVDGRRVAGDRPFNGSAGHGEWRGFEPYGQTDFSAGGFVPFESVPHLDDPGYVATANQRVTDDPGFYLSTSTRYADPYRGARIYERIEARVRSDEPVTRAFVRGLQGDVHSRAATQFVPLVADARDRGAFAGADPAVRAAADTVIEWRADGARMARDSRGALLWALFRDRVRNRTFHDEFAAAGLGPSYYPHYWTLGRLPADSRWFDDRTTPARETRADVVVRAMRGAVRAADSAGYDTYGDYNRLDLGHPFPLAFLDYPERRMDGSPFTVSNVRVERDTPAGSSWRMVVADRGDLGVIPGGQSGDYLSPHYRDQLGPWAAGGYKPMDRRVEGRLAVVFREPRAGADTEESP